MPRAVRERLLLSSPCHPVFIVTHCSISPRPLSRMPPSTAPLCIPLTPQYSSATRVRAAGLSGSAGRCEDGTPAIGGLGSSLQTFAGRAVEHACCPAQGDRHDRDGGGARADRVSARALPLMSSVAFALRILRVWWMTTIETPGNCFATLERPPHGVVVRLELSDVLVPAAGI